MKYITDDDWKVFEGLIGGAPTELEGSVTLRRSLAIRLHAALKDARRRAPSAHEHKIEIATILSNRTREGMIDLYVNAVHVQMDLPKAREVRGMLDGAIEAAVSDELIYKFLVDKIGLPSTAASAALLDFRELRQGSRSTVFPS